MNVYTEGSTVTITHPQTGDTITGTVMWISPTHATAMVKPAGNVGPIAYVSLADSDRAAIFAALTKRQAENRVA
ncbi:Uncharacterised protein [Mycobacteroides abscessus subsp. abscessus]|nr:Uncharacterised protein [Mycobacteroides abscessus subsp. abscessus]SHW69691.1 Uncharacterised protein [Mycobacteroides abscessus subsp. abscessus]SHY71856.1 Uncharacterised protein [Mycobacteroides abscessus subsp. abscessus]SHZ42941.1 Uncharacterised protein [Mycobacteroides abscessus subsp. abscessus]SKR90647.1 Uncharacterised protein [Mycobacteroides abscessus subsp. abscessus]